MSALHNNYNNNVIATMNGSVASFLGITSMIYSKSKADYMSIQIKITLEKKKQTCMVFVFHIHNLFSEFLYLKYKKKIHN